MARHTWIEELPSLAVIPAVAAPGDRQKQRAAYAAVVGHVCNWVHERR
jgi:hypothetical protein